MDIIVNKNLANFEFWAGGRDNAAKLTWDELDTLDGILEDFKEDQDRPFREEEINDIFRFNFERICELLGYRYDSNNDVIIRNVKED